MEKNFDELFNWLFNVHVRVLDKMPQRPIVLERDNETSLEKVQYGVDSLNISKAAGEMASLQRFSTTVANM